MKKRTRRLMACWALVAWVGTTPGLAESLQQRDAPQNGRDVEGMMEAYVLSKLQEALELTDEQFGSMVVAQKKLSDTRREYRRTRMQVLRQIRQTLQRDQAGQAELQPLLDELDTIRDTFAANEKTRYAAIDAVLDIRQRARYRVLEIELQRRLSQMMREVRGNRNERRQPDFP